MSGGGKEPKRTLYVGGLEEKIEEETLHAAFIPFGDLVEVHVPKDWETGKNRGFGFVEFEDDTDAADAIENMDGAELFGRVLRVNKARPAAHKLGSNTAVWSADDWLHKFASDPEEGKANGEAAVDSLRPS